MRSFSYCTSVVAEHHSHKNATGPQRKLEHRRSTLGVETNAITTKQSTGRLQAPLCSGNSAQQRRTTVHNRGDFPMFHCVSRQQEVSPVIWRRRSKPTALQARMSSLLESYSSATPIPQEVKKPLTTSMGELQLSPTDRQLRGDVCRPLLGLVGLSASVFVVDADFLRSAGDGTSSASSACSFVEQSVLEREFIQPKLMLALAQPKVQTTWDSSSLPTSAAAAAWPRQSYAARLCGSMRAW